MGAVTGRREPRCTWIAPSDDPDARLLVPGCMERVLDWDADCTCKTTVEELAEAEERAARLQAELDHQRDLHHALVAAVGRHRDAASLHAKAHEIYGERRRLKAAARRTEPNTKETPR